MQHDASVATHPAPSCIGKRVNTAQAKALCRRYCFHKSDVRRNLVPGIDPVMDPVIYTAHSKTVFHCNFVHVQGGQCKSLFHLTEWRCQAKKDTCIGQFRKGVSSVAGVHDQETQVVKICFAAHHLSRSQNYMQSLGTISYVHVRCVQYVCTVCMQ